MTSSLGWRADYKQPASAHVRAEAVIRHCGDVRSFLRRRERATLMAAEQGQHGLREIGPKLLRWAADTRSLRAAWDYLRAYGGSAPGPSNLTYEDLDPKATWELLRHLSQRIQNGDYSLGPMRRRRIPKGDGLHTRDLTLINIEDRVVQRAIVDTIQPILERTFDDRSYGFRPGRNRLQAWAQASAILQRERRYWWVVADVRDAFPSVPLRRLIDLLNRRFPTADGLLQLIEQCIDIGQTGKGLLQGAPLSPLLLNVYLDHFLDRVWRKHCPKLPLLRTADDILILCTTEYEARMAYDSLEQFLQPAGMLLKQSPSTGIRDVRHERAEWLGFGIKVRGEKPSIRLAGKALDHLHSTMTLAHEQPASPLCAAASLRGWMDQQGPCYPHENRGEILARVTAIVTDLGFDELLPVSDDLLGRWSAAHARWCRIHQKCLQVVSNDDTAANHTAVDEGDGSAHPRFFSTDSGRDGGTSQHDVPPSFSWSRAVVIYTDGCSLRGRKGIGGWAYVMHPDGLESRQLSGGGLRKTTNNRAELIAVIKALDSFDEPASVLLNTDSRYVYDGITEHLPSWKLHGWTSGSGKQRRPLKNTDLWQKLDRELARHAVLTRWVPAHSDNPLNELCDQLACDAASAMADRCEGLTRR